MRFANETEVSVEKSRVEIERNLSRYGATRFLYASAETGAVIAFQFQDKQIRFLLPLPDRSSKEFWYTPTRRTQRSQDEAFTQWEKACRQRWRALALNLKAKLEAVECGIESFEVAFMPYVVMPDGKTVADHVLPALAQNRLPELTF
jgi:2-polyprenyl-6-methoxyphenol hydroxylase-like FAD-dependent oxidoreductase